jgi:hypothetical protein
MSVDLVDCLCFRGFWGGRGCVVRGGAGGFIRPKSAPGGGYPPQDGPGGWHA